MTALTSLQISEPSPLPKARIVTCEGIEGLTAIKRPECELVIWQRRLSPGLRQWLDQLPAAQLPDFRILVKPEDLRAAMAPHFEACQLPQGVIQDMLVRDIESLVNLYAEISGLNLVDIRLERVVNDACWKFHRDSVEKRLLTTYRGATTQWVLPHHADQALEEQRDYRGPLEDLAADDVALFKGSRAEEGQGVVHRSPPIKGTGQTRLLLCLNKKSQASPEVWKG